MLKLNKVNNAEQNMITVKLILKDDKYYSLADEAFLKANMKKEGEGLYTGDGEEIFISSFLAIRSLLFNKDFVKEVDYFTRDCGDSEGEEDAMELYQYLIEEGKIYA